MFSEKTCSCHTGGAYAICDYPGGCGSSGGCCAQAGTCASVDRCRTPEAVLDGPFCTSCLTGYQRDIRSLLFDYLDLAQLHEPALTQAVGQHTSGSKEKPIPISANVEALQAEIVHALLTWEHELREHAGYRTGRLLDIPAWATTRSNPLPQVKSRAGALVQRAATLLATHTRRLSQLPATTVQPTGVEDEHQDLTGADAILHLASLHGRAKATLGRTVRRFWIPGDCWSDDCGARDTPDVDGVLYRSEPRYPKDPMQVTCDRCRDTRPYVDYEHLQAHLRWPEQYAQLTGASA